MVQQRSSRPSVKGFGTMRDARQHPTSGEGPLAPDPNGELELAGLPVRRWAERRVAVLGLAALLFIATFAGSLISESGLDELVVLYVLPVLLAGLELGLSGGAGAAAIAILLMLVASGHQSELNVVGLATSTSVFVIAGVLAGAFSERMRAGRHLQERLLASGLRLARLENLDALPAALAAELQLALNLESVEVGLCGMPAIEIGRPAGDTLRVPISAHGIAFGSVTLGVPAGRSFTPEDRVVAAKLAAQAGVAADNQRLLASERERAALHADLEHTRTRLDSHLRNVNRILDNQEEERREIARHLHEQAAQAMAGVLFGLHVLERDLDRELTRKQLAEVSDIARSTLADLRQLALSMRPPSLDDLGLASALETIAEREGSRGARRITLHCESYPRDLAPQIETCVYRVVEDAIQALDGSLSIKLRPDRDRDTLRIEVSGHSMYRPERLLDRLATARARVELIGGTLQTSPHATDGTSIIAELPLHPTITDSNEPR